MRIQTLTLLGMACAFAEAVPWTIYNNDIPGRMTFDSAYTITLTSDPVPLPRATPYSKGYEEDSDFAHFAGTIKYQRETEMELASQIAKESRRHLPAHFELRFVMSEDTMPESCQRVIRRINNLASTQGLGQVSLPGSSKRLTYDPIDLLEDYFGCRTDVVYNSLYLGNGDVDLLGQPHADGVSLAIPYLPELGRTSRWGRGASKEENKANTLVFGTSGSVIQKTSTIVIPLVK